MSSDNEGKSGIGKLAAFFAILILLTFFRIALGYVSVSSQWLKVATLVNTVVFVGVPIFALFFAAQFRWTWQRALAFLLSGLVVQFGIGSLIGGKLLAGKGLLAAICLALGPQVGLVTWCIGVGVLLSTLIKDKNLIIPVSIFLILFDIYLVLTPVGITNRFVQGGQILSAIGYSVPRAQAAAVGGPVGTYAYVGPADFLFMGMFFVALFKFRLRATLTMLLLVPTLLLYLVLITYLKAIPLLVPIGGCVLLVNLSEFKMTREEKISTVGVAVLGLLIIAGSYLLRGKHVGPLPKAGVQASPISTG